MSFKYAGRARKAGSDEDADAAVECARKSVVEGVGEAGEWGRRALREREVKGRGRGV